MISQRPRLKESTCSKYRNMLSLHILPAFGHMKLSSIDAATIEAFGAALMDRNGSGLSPKNGKDILVLFHSILKYACRREEIRLPVAEVVFPRETKKEMRVLSEEEQTLFVGYLLRDPDPLRMGILLALLTGMRIGEICALRWGDLSREDRTVRIDRTMQRIQLSDGGRVKTRVVIGEPKSESSKRVIPLTEQAYRLCVPFWQEDPLAYVVTGVADRFAEPRLVQYHLKKIEEACGLEGLHFHALRHTFATRCIEVGVEMKTLSELLGHSGVKITMDRYVHSSLDFKRANMEKLSVVGM